ncbi:MAG: HAD family hydrolase [Clostridia bacterium]|nr:HAD family hydrolase [Clostridia bacterium]
MSDKQALACFDFDGTMIDGDSITAYLRLAFRRGDLSPVRYAAVGVHTLGYFLGWESGDAVKTHALRFRKAMPPERREELDRLFAERELLPRIYPEALACWRAHQQAGRKVLLVSASTDQYMRHVAKALGADALLCTPVLADETVAGNCKGEEKPRRILEWLKARGIQADFEASYAYGDSASDLPMLRMVGHPVQVNPKKKLLRAAPDMERVAWGKR